MKKPRFPGGRKLKGLREARGWKVDRAAVEIGISRPTLDNLERGLNWPSGETLAKIARVYGISLDEFLAEFFPAGG